MFLARMVFFRLHESPRYLVHAGRPQDAIESLQLISRFNGSELTLDLEDVVDRIEYEDRPPLRVSYSSEHEENTPLTSAPIFDADAPAPAQDAATPPPAPLDGASRSGTPPDHPAYAATGESNTGLENHTFATPVSTLRSMPAGLRGLLESANDADVVAKEQPEPEVLIRSPPLHVRPRTTHSRGGTGLSRRSSIVEVGAKVWWHVPRSVRRPLGAWLGRFAMVLSPEWIRTTVLVWTMWLGMSLGALRCSNTLSGD
jgi:hypothetical protein